MTRVGSGPPSRAAGVLAGISILALTSISGSVAAASGESTSWVCVEVSADALPPAAWGDVIAAVSTAVASRTDLFPAPAIVSSSPASSGEAPPVSYRIDITPDVTLDGPPQMPNECLGRNVDWTILVGRDFLDVGADRMLELAPTTPGISSNVEVSWFPAENRVRTTLHFAGPFDIPNGTCWIDDTLSTDTQLGRYTSEQHQGLETSPFAESACGRFFDYLANGGAGEQATKLLPLAIDRSDGRVLELIPTEVVVGERDIRLGGTVRVR